MRRFIVVLDAEPDLLSVARSLTPHIQLCSSRGLILRVTRRTERKDVAALNSALSLCGSDPRLAMASTRIAALFAAAARPGTSVADGREEKFLSRLPVSLLAILPHLGEPDFLVKLYQWGVGTLGELAALPAQELIARVGPLGECLQGVARGEDVVSFPDCEEEILFEERQELEAPLDSLEPLSFMLGRLLDRLCAHLAEFGHAVEQLEVTFQLENRTCYRHTLRLAFPLRSPRVLLSLLRLDLQSHPPSAPVLSLSLRAIPAPARVTQHSLLHRPIPHPEELSRTLARLTTLLGEKNIGTPRLPDTHRPDAFTLEPFEIPDRQELEASTASSGHALSLRRLRPPVPFRAEIVTRAGPWRTSGEWWDRFWNRDEWDVELRDGSLCRIYWDRQSKRWFLEGVYD